MIYQMGLLASNQETGTREVQEKSQICHLGRNNRMHQQKLKADKLESNFAEKDYSILVDTKLNMTQQ